MRASAIIVAVAISLVSINAKAGTEVASDVVSITEIQLTPGVSTANEDAVAILMNKLNERDLTIKEIQQLNLDLQVENSTLKEINAKLRRQVAAKSAELKRLKVKYQRAANDTYRDVVMQIKSLVSNF